MNNSTNDPEQVGNSPLPDVNLADLPKSLREAVKRADWPGLMPVQMRGIPYLLKGRDMMIQARTGSGKTGAYLLPMLERLDPKSSHPQALVLVPTRELAHQVWQQANLLLDPSGLRSVAVYGGVGYSAQNEALKGGTQVVIGTPGRVLDHLLKRTFNLDRLRMLIFDEADRMLSMGFYPDMQQVQRYLPKQAVHTCMFSATFPASVMHTAREFMHNPEYLSLSSDHVHVTDTEHVYYVTPGMDKDRSLVRIIETENPTSAIIFCNTKARVHYIAVVLKRFGYDADELSADLSQNERERVLNRVRKGSLRFLVATDVAARGLDIPELSHVIQYEPPSEVENYIHRAGRTGRAGSTGVAIMLVSSVEKSALDRIARQYDIQMQERSLPTDEDVAALVAERLTALLEARLRQRDKLQTERSRRLAPLAHSLAEHEDETAIITMLLDDYYQQMLHTPVPQPETVKPPEASSESTRGKTKTGRKSLRWGRRDK
ncbi:MAG: DEAD/DEAH box helicase [Chloroflexi bacterium GWB2_49_20]|nr:MAG: DEAD/DEAH box helicase [Chloroflexi bacterium GWB2_49_20]OGN77094.1 MAG: DEAD/DEAH box helicase [Chloroflexi bacterium GWC2_49_37]OGN83820.1 MAG: DEAD/DEAH box helicase [Chloroflexi bacterium GWD2_49_16]